MITIVKQLKPVHAAHRLTHGFVGKCENIHGHSYKVEVALTGTQDTVGMVVDFSIVASLFDEWLQNNWDHALIIDDNDTELLEMITKLGNRHYIVSWGGATTAENMAKFLYGLFVQLLASKRLASSSTNVVGIKWVRVHETATAFAEYTNDK